MDRTNAERQRRHRERVKLKLAAAEAVSRMTLPPPPAVHMPGGGKQRTKTSRFSVARIVVPERRARGRLDDAVVTNLAESMAEIGLQTPISVLVEDVPGDEAVRATLVAGRHRLEAARRLGWPMIECVPLTDPDQARMWEISENLHRADLTDDERQALRGEWDRAVAAKHAAALAGGKPNGVR
jgi:hypothetical protein